MVGRKQERRDWFKHTDLGNAERLARHARGKLLWVKGLGWLYWDAKRWNEASTGEEVREATAMVRAIHAEAAHYSREASKAKKESEAKELSERASKLISWARKSESRDKIKAAIDLARSRRGLVARVEDLDAKANSLNVANGILDLDLLTITPHDPGALHTKVANAAFHKGVKSVRWEEFLERILPDKKTRRWVQKMAGYSLLGQYSEYLPIAWGAGKNGKSVFLRALRYALGDYAAEAAPELLVSKRGSASAGDEAAIAALRGKRFVTTIETGEGQRLDETTVKRLTGEHEITAKFMRQNHITFHNQTATWFATNHKPRIDGSDDAIWNRVALVPFNVWIPPNERDRHLGEKMEGEADGILAWAIEGLRLFRKGGMDLPPEIANATDVYKDEMDRLGGWLSECCELVAGAITPIKWVQESYADYCRNANIHPDGAVRFNLQLEARGLERKKKKIKRKQVKVWEGIRLLDADERRAAQEFTRKATERKAK